MRIGNSKGIRIPQSILEQYRWAEGMAVELEVRRDGLLLKPIEDSNKVSWETAYREMAEEVAEGSEWGDWDGVSGDGRGTL